MSSSLPRIASESSSLHRHCTLYVCTSCRAAGTPRGDHETRPGFLLYEQLRKAVDASDIKDAVEVRPAECLSLCRRPCGIALCSEGAWTYLFGDQQLGEGPSKILECVSVYLKKKDGHMSRSERPNTLRASILGRVPPPSEKE